MTALRALLWLLVDWLTGPQDDLPPSAGREAFEKQEQERKEKQRSPGSPYA